MGDMADYVNEQIEQDYYDLYQYRSGVMSHDEAYDRGIIDEFGCEYYSYRTKTCRCCGEKNLEWGKYKGKWRLFKIGGGIHVCPVHPLK